MNATKKGRFSLMGLLGVKQSPYELTNREEEHAAQGMVNGLTHLADIIKAYLKQLVWEILPCTCP